MSSCTGRGSCIKQCVCVCENELQSECSCGHQNHSHFIGGTTEFDVYCRIECPHKCQLVKCHNFRLCEKKYPQEVLDCNNGMCNECARMFGKINFLEEKDECPICFENKDMIVISCGKHKVCFDCWKKMSETKNRPLPLTCPLCRESIWKRR